MTALIMVGCMVAFGSFGASFGLLYEDRTSDLPGFGFMFYGLLGCLIGAVLGAVISSILI